MSIKFKYPRFNGYALSYLLMAPSDMHNALVGTPHTKPATMTPSSQVIQDAMTGAGFVYADQIVQDFASVLPALLSPDFDAKHPGGLTLLYNIGQFLYDILYSGGGGHPPANEARQLVSALQVFAAPYDDSKPKERG